MLLFLYSSQQLRIQCGTSPSTFCAGCLVSITAHGPRAGVAQVLRGEHLVEDSGQGLQEGLEGEGQNKGEKEIGEERHEENTMRR